MAHSDRTILILWATYIAILLLAYFLAETYGKCKKDYRHLRKDSSHAAVENQSKYNQNKFMVKEPRINRHFSKYSFDNPALDNPALEH